MAINKIMNIILRMKGAKKAKQDLKGVGGGLKSLAKKAATAAAGFFAVTKAMESVKLAGKFEGVKRGFDNLTKSVGFSTSTFDKLKRATDGTVKSMELMELANNAMLLGIFDSEDQMAKTFDVAQRLASALGKDARYGVESLVTGLGRQSKLMLDNLGIVFDVNKAYDEYAATLGVTASELTDAQKKQAFVNKALSEADTLVSNLGDEQLTTADTFSRAGAAVEEFTIAIGEMLAPVVEVALPAINKLVSAMQKIPYMQMPKAVKEDAIAYADMMRSHAAGYTETMVALAKEPEKLKILLGIVNEQIDALNKAVEQEAGYGLVVDPVIENYNQLAATIKDLIGIQETSEGATKAAAAATKAAAASYQSWLATQQEGLDKKELELKFISRLIEENYELAKAMGFVEDATQLSLEQIASIQSEFNEQYREMTKSSFELQYLELENSVERFRTAKIDEVEIAQYVAERKKQIAADEAHFQQKTVGSLVGALGQLNQASKGNAKLSKGLAITSALIDTYAAANKALKASPPPWNFIAAAAVTAAGLANVMQIKSQKFHSGGLVGGQGDTPIMAQSGEFVLSRSAVQDIGVDTAQRINQGGGAGITVNIHGGIVQDDYIRNELLPAISRAEEMGA